MLSLMFFDQCWSWNVEKKPDVQTLFGFLYDDDVIDKTNQGQFLLCTGDILQMFMYIKPQVHITASVLLC